MTLLDDIPSAAQLRAEIAQMSADHLREVARTLAWPLHPLRMELDTTARLAAARQAIADLDRRHDLDVWRQPGARSWATPAHVAAARLQALALAWARLGGGHEFRFHMRGELRPNEDRPLSREHHLGAPRMAIHPNFWIRDAPYLEHPLSLAEVARFAIVLPVMRCCAALGEAVAAAFDALGQPTHFLHFLDQQQPTRLDRHIVWRARSPERSRRSYVRMLGLAAVHLLDDSGAANERQQIGVPALTRHYSEWTQLETAIVGELAWRLACERDVRVQPRRSPIGHAITPNPATIGRRYCELDDPFEPLLVLLRLGCRLHELSREAVTLVIDPRPGH